MKVLCIDDHKFGSAALHATLEAHGYRVIVAPDANHVVPQLAASRPDAVILDCHMENAGCQDVVKAIRAARPNTPVVMLSACCGSKCEKFALADACVQVGSGPVVLLETLELVIRAAHFGLCRSIPDPLAA